jgi:hypothetical protein
MKQSSMFPLTMSELASVCRDNGYLCPRILANGRTAAIRPGIFNCSIIVDVDAFGCNEEFTYETSAAAVDALAAWDTRVSPEPTGWIRHMPSGRRRPGGDPSREHTRTD